MTDVHEEKCDWCGSNAWHAIVRLPSVLFACDKHKTNVYDVMLTKKVGKRHLTAIYGISEWRTNKDSILGGKKPRSKDYV